VENLRSHLDIRNSGPNAGRPIFQPLTLRLHTRSRGAYAPGWFPSWDCAHPSAIPAGIARPWDGRGPVVSRRSTTGYVLGSLREPGGTSPSPRAALRGRPAKTGVLREAGRVTHPNPAPSRPSDFGQRPNGFEPGVVATPGLHRADPRPASSPASSPASCTLSGRPLSLEEF
jgi:hypothetical protein